DLPVEEQGLGRQGAHCSGHVAVRGGPVVRVPRHQPDARALFVRQDPNPVIFLFVDPARTVKRFVDQRRQHRTNPKGDAAGHLGRRRAAAPPSLPVERAIWVSVRLETADRAEAVSTSSLEANSSRCLMRSHDSRLDDPLRGNPRVRTRTQEPLSFLPSRVNFKSPRRSAASTSGSSGRHVPVSQTITVPAPYSPSGIWPSTAAYSTG